MCFCNHEDEYMGKCSRVATKFYFEGIFGYDARCEEHKWRVMNECSEEEYICSLVMNE